MTADTIGNFGFGVRARGHRTQGKNRDTEFQFHWYKQENNIHPSPFSENRRNEEENSGGIKVLKDIREKKIFVLIPLCSVFIVVQKANLIFSSYITGNTNELLLQGLPQFSDSRYTLLPYSCIQDASSTVQEGRKKNGGRLSLSVTGKKERTMMASPHGHMLTEPHPIKCVGQGVHFINFCVGGRLTGLVLT
jgi:hypothetical protein